MPQYPGLTMPLVLLLVCGSAAVHCCCFTLLITSLRHESCVVLLISLLSYGLSFFHKLFGLWSVFIDDDLCYDKSLGNLLDALLVA